MTEKENKIRVSKKKKLSENNSLLKNQKGSKGMKKNDGKVNKKIKGNEKSVKNEIDSDNEDDKTKEVSVEKDDKNEVDEGQEDSDGNVDEGQEDSDGNVDEGQEDSDGNVDEGQEDSDEDDVKEDNQDAENNERERDVSENEEGDDIDNIEGDSEGSDENVDAGQQDGHSDEENESEGESDEDETKVTAKRKKGGAIHSKEAPTKKKKKNEDNVEDGGRKIFVGNLPYSVQNQDVEDFFKEKNIDCEKVEVSFFKGRSKGYGYVTVSSVEEVERILQLDDITLEGRTLRLEKVDKNHVSKQSAGKKQGNEGKPTKLLLVKNLNYSTDQDSLSSHFSEASEVRLMKDRETGQSRGFAFVEFETSEAAASAKKEMIGKEIDGRSINIIFAIPSEDFKGGRGGRRGGRGGRGNRGGRGRGGRGFKGGRGRGRNRGWND